MPSPTLRRLLPACAAVLGLAVLAPNPLSAQTATYSSSVQQSNFNGETYGPPPPAVGGATAPINPDGTTGPAANPFTFNLAQVASLQSITSISITMTIFDGKTDAAGAEFNEWTLALDNIDTGIRLNGFTTGQEIRLTISGTTMQGAAILAALQADNQLNARIYDSGDTGLPGGGAQNFIIPSTQVGGTPINAVLTITGAVPEPGTYALFGVGLVALGCVAFRRHARRGAVSAHS